MSQNLFSTVRQACNIRLYIKLFQSLALVSNMLTQYTVCVAPEQIMSGMNDTFSACVKKIYHRLKKLKSYHTGESFALRVKKYIPLGSKTLY